MTQEREYSEEEKLALTLADIIYVTDDVNRKDELTSIKQKILDRTTDYEEGKSNY